MKIDRKAEAEEIDLHGYHPDDIDLVALIEQAWQAGITKLRLIHGHGHWRGRSVGFVNTNTGYFGLRIRSDLRHHPALKNFIVRSSLDCTHDGSTTIRLRSNPTPTRARDAITMPERTHVTPWLRG